MEKIGVNYVSSQDTSGAIKTGVRPVVVYSYFGLHPLSSFEGDMARINIEDKWWSDPRRISLSIKLGAGLADGVFLNAVKLSQDFNGEPFDATHLLPEEWVQALLSTGLATGKQSALYIKGSKEHHEWIKKQRANASKGGKARSNKINNMQQAVAKQLLDFGMPSSSSSSSSSKSNTVVVEKNETVIDDKMGDYYDQDSNKVLEVFKKHFNQIPSELRNKKKAIYQFYGKDMGLLETEVSDLIQTAKTKFTGDAVAIRRWVQGALVRKISNVA